MLRRTGFMRRTGFATPSEKFVRKVSNTTKHYAGRGVRKVRPKGFKYYETLRRTGFATPSEKFVRKVSNTTKHYAGRGLQPHAGRGLQPRPKSSSERFQILRNITDGVANPVRQFL